MSIYTFYPIVERLLLLVLAIQLIRHTLKSKNPFIPDFEIQLFATVCILNHIGFLLFEANDFTFLFYHTTAPIALILGIIRYTNLKPPITIALVSASSFLLILIENYYIILGLYYIALYLTIRKSLRLLEKRNSELQKSPLYLVLSLDLLASMIILVLRNTEYNWDQSNLLDYMYIASLIIFTTTLILLNVKFRRFFTD